MKDIFWKLFEAKMNKKIESRKLTGLVGWYDGNNGKKGEDSQ
jgi:hypothetical protein